MTFEKLRICEFCGNPISDPEDTDLTAFIHDVYNYWACDGCIREYSPRIVSIFEEEKNANENPTGR